MKGSRINLPGRPRVKDAVKALNPSLDFNSACPRTILQTVASAKLVATVQEITLMLLAVATGALTGAEVGTVGYVGVKHQAQGDAERASSASNPLRHFGNGTLTVRRGGAETDVHALFQGHEYLAEMAKSIELDGHVLTRQQQDALQEAYGLDGRALNYVDSRREGGLQKAVLGLLSILGPAAEQAALGASVPEWVVVDRVLHGHLGQVKEALRAGDQEGLMKISNYRVTSPKDKNDLRTYQTMTREIPGGAVMVGASRPERERAIREKVGARFGSGASLVEVVHLILDSHRILNRMAPATFGGYLPAPAPPGG